MKLEKQRKREDEEEEKQDAKAKEVGEKIKKESKKDKGKLKQLIKAIHSADPTKTKYIVLIIDFSDAPTTHLTLTPFNTEKIIDHLRDITKDREVREDNYLVRLIPRKRVKSFKLVDRKSSEETEKATYEKQNKAKQ